MKSSVGPGDDKPVQQEKPDPQEFDVMRARSEVCSGIWSGEIDHTRRFAADKAIDNFVVVVLSLRNTIILQEAEIAMLRARPSEELETRRAQYERDLPGSLLDEEAPKEMIRVVGTAFHDGLLEGMERLLPRVRDLEQELQQWRDVGKAATALLPQEEA